MLVNSIISFEIATLISNSPKVLKNMAAVRPRFCIYLLRGETRRSLLRGLVKRIETLQVPHDQLVTFGMFGGEMPLQTARTDGF